MEQKSNCFVKKMYKIKSLWKKLPHFTVSMYYTKVGVRNTQKFPASWTNNCAQIVQSLNSSFKAN